MAKWNYEARARAMDNTSESISANSRRIAKTLRRPVNTIHSYLTAKRNGFPSRKQYNEHIFREKGFPSHSKYTQSRRTIRGDREPTKKKTLTLETRSLTLYQVYPFEEEERNELLYELVGKLNPEQREIIDLLYFPGIKLREAAQVLGLKGRRQVEVREDLALARLRELAESPRYRDSLTA